MDTSTKLTVDNFQSSSATLSSLPSSGLQDSISPTLSASPSSNIHKTLIVNSTADVVDNSDNFTTLREAINTANTDGDNDLIIFDSSIFSTGQQITLNLGELDITHSLNINAPIDFATGKQLVTISGNKNSRVFEITAGASVSFSGLIITDGRVANENGAGIKNSGNLTLSNSVVRNNSAGLNGGGIYNTNGASLTLNNSVLSANSSGNGFNDANGGGIFNSTGSVEINNSLISGNRADGRGTGAGGGVYNDGGSMILSNSTISGNNIVGRITGRGGGVYNN